MTRLLVLAVWVVWAVLRAMYFIGDYMEDAPGFAANAMTVASGQWEPRHDLQGLRVGTYIPAGLAMYLFGRTELALATWPLVSSALGLAALFGIGRELRLGRWALLPAVLWATYPGDVLFSTVLMPDAVQAGWLLVAVFLLLSGMNNASAPQLMAAGAAAGVAYLVRENILLLVPVLVAGVLVLPNGVADGLRTRIALALAFAAGLAGVMAGESVYYWSAVGTPFHRAEVSQAYYGASDAISRHGLHADMSTIPLTMIPPLEWARGTLMPFTLNAGQAYHGYVFLIALVAWVAAASLVFGSSREDRARFLFLSAWFFVPVLYHQYGSQSLSSWVPMHRLPRQFVLYATSAVVVIGWSASQVAARSTGRSVLLRAALAAVAALGLFAHTAGASEGLSIQRAIVRETTGIRDRVVGALRGYSGRVHIDSAEIAGLEYLLNVPGRAGIEFCDLLSAQSCDALAGSLVLTHTNPGWSMRPKPELLTRAEQRLPCLTSPPRGWVQVFDAPWLPEKIYAVGAVGSTESP